MRYHYRVNPLISILLPTYEPHPEHLRAALDSLQNQTLLDWELLIHDDASSADVRAMIEPSMGDARITFKRSDRRLGIGGNWNACRKFGSAPFVQYLFQDDLWNPTYLQRASEILKRYDPIGFVATHHEYVFEGDIDPERRRFYQSVEELRLTEMRPGRNDHGTFLESWITHGLHPNLIGEPSFVMVRRSLMESVGPFREDMPQGLDTECWLRCLVRSDFFFINESLGHFRVHPAAATARNDAEGQGLFDRIGFYDTLMCELPNGHLRSLAKKSLVAQFAAMALKFRARRKKGGRTGTGGSGALIRIALRHPLLMIRGMLRAFANTRRADSLTR